LGDCLVAPPLGSLQLMHRRERGHRKTYIVESIQELPEDLQRRIFSVGITESEAAKHLEVLLNILHFKTKQFFYTKATHEAKEANPVRRHNRGHSLISQQIVSVATLQEESATLLEPWKKVDFKMMQMIGKGGFGHVFLATSQKDKTPMAIKRIPHISTKQKRKNYQEIRFLMFCKGTPNILQFESAAVPDPDRNEMWLATEYVNGGTLTNAVSEHPFTEPQIAYLCCELLKGIAFLHANMLAHRDLKSANIMISLTGDVKLIDFGLCSDVSQGEVVHMVGSPFWMPPEMIKRQPHGLPVDVWSFGICCMEMANGHPPNRHSSISAMFIAAVYGYPEPFEENKWSQSFTDFLDKCLQITPSDRWTVPRLQAHPFLLCRANRDQMTKLFCDLFEKNTYSS